MPAREKRSMLLGADACFPNPSRWNWKGAFEGQFTPTARHIFRRASHSTQGSGVPNQNHQFAMTAIVVPIKKYATNGVGAARLRKKNGAIVAIILRPHNSQHGGYAGGKRNRCKRQERSGRRQCHSIFTPFRMELITQNRHGTRGPVLLTRVQ